MLLFFHIKSSNYHYANAKEKILLNEGGNLMQPLTGGRLPA
jgi:hypothetical protein